MKDVLMPAQGVAMTEGLIVSWLKEEGAVVVVGEPLAEVETDKATIEIVSPAGGRLGPHLYGPGESAAIGTPIARILEGSEDSTDSVAPGMSAANPIDQSARIPSSADLVPQQAQASVRVPHAQSPRARLLAKRAAESGTPLPNPTTPDPGTPGVDERVAQPADAVPVAGSIWVPGRHRQLIADVVSESWRTIPHFAVTREIDAEALLKVRDELRSVADVTITDLLLRALALALAKSGYPRRVDVGLAVATEAGVAIPVIRGILSLSWVELAAIRKAAVDRARAGRLSGADLADPPPVTLSNLGQLGVDQFTGVIAVGQVGVLTVGRVAPRVGVVNGAVGIHSTIFVTLTVDHRHFDGDHAARLLGGFAEVCQAEDRLREGLSA